MKKHFWIVFLIVVLTNKLFAQSNDFSDSTKVSLITCSPGYEIYSKFGHSGLRLNDPINNIDVIFNYGVFSFETNNFYYKFIRGETDYQLGIYETSFFLAEYEERNSSVWEQVLNLSFQEKRKLINLLLENAVPENRVYRYNFIFDNCATRPKDMIIKSLNEYIEYTHRIPDKTFRQWIGTYVGFDTWTKFGIDAIFGIDADKIVSKSEILFLPEELMRAFEGATIKDTSGVTKHLVSSHKQIVIKAADTNSSANFAPKPIYVTLSMLIIGVLLTFWDYKKRKHNKTFDCVLLSITGIGGIVVSYLMFFSVHPLVKSNFNIFWLNPLNIFVAIAIWIRPLKPYLFFYQIINMILITGTLVAFALSAQVINYAAFPIIVTLLIRSTSWFAYTKGRLFKLKKNNR